MQLEKNFIEAKLTEYIQIKEEIKHYLNRRVQNKNFAIVLSLGVIGAGIKLDNYYLFFATAIIILSFWIDEVRRLKAIFRCGAYIEVNIEKYIDGLEFESLLAKHPLHLKKSNYASRKSKFERYVSNLDLPFLYCLNSFLGLKLIYGINTLLLILLITMYASFLLAAIIFTLNVTRDGRAKQVEQWKKIISEEKTLPNNTYA